MQSSGSLSKACKTWGRGSNSAEVPLSVRDPVLSVRFDGNLCGLGNESLVPRRIGFKEGNSIGADADSSNVVPSLLENWVALGFIPVDDRGGMPAGREFKCLSLCEEARGGKSSIDPKTLSEVVRDISCISKSGSEVAPLVVRESS